MKKVVDGIYTFENLMMGRVYLLEDDNGLTLVDASIDGAGKKIIRQLKASGYNPQDVKRILMTHAHPDHIGGLAVLVAETGAEIWCHELEKPVIEQIKANTGNETLTVNRTLADKEQLPIIGGLQVIFTPGHAPGHICFWQEDQRLLIVGDVIFYMLNRMTQPFGMFTPDPEENRRSIKKIYDMEPQSLLFGHGQPIISNSMDVLTPFVKRSGLA